MKHACEKISHLASEQLERKLNLKERFLMKFHFLMCGACRCYGKNILLLHETLNLRIDDEISSLKLSDTKRASIQRCIQQLLKPKG